MKKYLMDLKLLNLDIFLVDISFQEKLLIKVGILKL
jgi:hypothetical protein